MKGDKALPTRAAEDAIPRAAPLYLVGMSSGKNAHRPLNEPEIPNIPIIEATVEIMKYLLVLSTRILTAVAVRREHIAIERNMTILFFRPNQAKAFHMTIRDSNSLSAIRKKFKNLSPASDEDVKKKTVVG